MRDLAARQAVVDAGVAELGHLDIVVANAGIPTMSERRRESAERSSSDVIDVNLAGVWNTASDDADLVARGTGGGHDAHELDGGHGSASRTPRLLRGQARRGRYHALAAATSSASTRSG